ncbi:DUF4861 family protein [Thalassotalea fonticola]|uniref:DUF4861 family protein n=1 Tax=Thalassotalea fonticola TaxID=3065649 RepID=A0ABZ0GL94_9GAMM|nr:DUF4861 family protein [Colwelliaceae bacterium S1-1]
MKNILLLSLFTSVVLSAGCSNQQQAEHSEVKAYAKFVPEREDDFAWENDLVAFRMYGPSSKSTGPASGVDCWLKRVNYSILDKWYDNFQNKISYHVDRGEGYDPYHTGTTRGCGGTAIWLEGKPQAAGTFKAWRIIENSKQQVSFELDYAWQTDLGQIKETKRVSLALGSQLFAVESMFLLNNLPAKHLSIAIGLSTHDGAASVSSEQQSAWIATWEKIGDFHLGTGAMVAPNLVDEIIHQASEEKDQSHIWLVSHTDEYGKFRYQAGYAWERANQITSKQAWHEYLQQYNTVK